MVDSFSIIPGSEVIQAKNGTIILRNQYTLNYPESKLCLKSEFKGKEIKISYRVFPLLFSEEYAHKSMNQLEQEDIGQYDFFTIKDEKKKSDVFAINGLNKNGSISRGVNFGNSQDLSVNSNLDLQLSGKVTEDINIQAAISDNSLPIQADGNTQQLQEFDRVYIKLFNKHSTLIAGDYRISRPESYFMNYNKKVQGGGFSTEIITKKELNELDNGVLKTAVNAAISRGKFSRDVRQGQEGNQGPYQLEGAEGEQFIIILSGTERVYVNGRLMKRGQENDYIIDYNTAELTFTPNQIINKDKRIVVEFQYSELNYSRTVFTSENQYKKEKLHIDFNLYSEQDNKNLPLQQDLTDSEKQTLVEAGDNLDAAIVSGIDTAGFEDDQVRYKLIDTLGTQILVYSTNPDSALYSARFSRVSGGGYEQERSDANGRVFKFVGFGSGTHAPIIKLITPKKRQMFTLGGKYDFSESTSLSIESAITNNDLNTFSDSASNDNQSYGLKIGFNHSQLINQSDSNSQLRWNSAIFYEQRGRDFQFVERYRDVEFERDWNISNLTLEGNEYIIRASTGLSKGKNFFNYNFKSFTKGNDYEGLMNGYAGNYNKGGFSIQSRGSYLTANTQSNSEFLRHYTTVSQQIFGLKVGAYLEDERILFYDKDTTDFLTGASFDRIIWNGFIEKGDSTSDNSYRLSYGEIYDDLPANGNLIRAQKSRNYDFEFSRAKNRNSRLSGKVTYRSLEHLDDEVPDKTPEENTILGRLQYDLKAFKGFLNSNTFYQIGSGLENKREFSFLQVNDGQGTHVWRDFNDNGVKELNEFQVAGANNIFEANYIRVFTPTSDFIRVYNNQFNQLIFLKPNALFSGKKGLKKIIGKFSNKAAYRIEKETEEEDDVYNPFDANINDSSLISILSSFANTFYFNRLNPKFGAEFFYLNTAGKNLLTNGFESRNNITRELRARYNINRIYSAEARVTNGERATKSEFFDNRNFTIESNEIEPKFIYQPSVKFRLTLSAIYTEKENIIGELGEKSEIQTLSSELRFNEASKGSFSLAASFIRINFNADQNNPLAFEMLEGLNKGENITWDIRWQRTLANNLQLNLNYGGRQSEGIRMIHTGGMQLRAFF